MYKNTTNLVVVKPSFTISIVIIEFLNDKRYAQSISSVDLVHEEPYGYFIFCFYGRKTSEVTHSPLYNNKRFLKVKRVSQVVHHRYLLMSFQIY